MDGAKWIAKRKPPFSKGSRVAERLAAAGSPLSIPAPITELNYIGLGLDGRGTSMMTENR
jgi:hypothetical protein